MTYRIQADESVLDGVQRIAHEQVERALRSLEWDDSSDRGAEDGIHDCRKRCKRVRALVRLVRPAMSDGQYASVNETFRDASRALSPFRDAHALLSTFDDLLDTSSDQFAGLDIVPIRRELDRRARTSTDHLTGDAEPVRIARDLLLAGRSGIDDWNLTASEWDAIDSGIEKSYERGHSALALAAEAPTPENFHQWRKRVKYTWNHLRLVRESAPTLVQPLADAFHSLSGALGDAHDLAVLREQFDADPEAFGGTGTVDAALVIVDGRRVDLERRSIAFGSRLYAEKPKHCSRRLGIYWDVWRDLGAEPAVGELADVAP